MAKISCFKKFQLLLWKNWEMELNRKAQFAVQLVMPIMFTMILVSLRYVVVPKRLTQVIYDPVPISNLGLLYQSLSLTTFAGSQPEDDVLPILKDPYKPDSYPRKVLPYSPKNGFIQDIMEQAASSLLLGTEGYFNAKALKQELDINSYIAGVEFDDSMVGLENFPEKIKFALHFPGELRTKVQGLGTSWQTFRLFPIMSGSFPRNYNDTDGGVPVGYAREGFIAIQNAISRAFISLKSGKEDIPKVQIRRFPYPPFIYDPLLLGLKGAIPLIVVIGYIYPCSCIARDVAYEKEKQLKEVMKIMGLPNMLHWLAWFVRGMVILLLASLLMLFFLLGKFQNDVAVFTYSDWFVMFTFLCVYCATSVCFCFMLTVFFSKASTAAAATGLILFIAHLPYMLLMQSYASMSRAAKLAWCLISNSAVAFGIDVILGFEGTGEGQQWSNLFDPVNIDNNVTLGEIMGMMLLSALIYLAICLYVEQVFPGRYGMPRKWYFVFTRKFWCSERKYKGVSDFATSKMQRRSMQDAFEMEPSNKFTGLQIINLNKKFGKFWAVQNLSLNMFEDEITVLLGHNGAGKTTTISMLTGLFPPTSGTAIVSGYDIRTDIEGARSSLGICPQYNVLFDDLSVSNHIKFFCLLRGIDKRDIKKEIKKYLRLIDIEKKANTPSSKLSGGMQRKLSVCCALCGGTKVVLCDEPSSGMDPSARRYLWNLLQAEKAGRTVLLTTHFMDEADVLGDRIAIMSAGQLKCYGSAFFLKKKFGSGYRLTCIKREDCDPQLVTNLLRQYIPDITHSDGLGAELSYQLPYKDSKVFEEMLGVLEENSDKLGLNGYGISITSMEEVFMKVGAESITGRKSVILNLSQKEAGIYEDDVSDSSINTQYTFGNTDALRSRKRSIILNQFHAMFLKKFLYTWRKKMLFLMQNLIPIYFIVTAIYISRSLVHESLPPLPITLRDYDFATTVLEVNPLAKSTDKLTDIGKEYESIARSFGPTYHFISTKGEPFENYMLRLGKTKQVLINQRFMVAATVGADGITAWFNNQALHTAPLTVNLVNNAIARALIGPNAEIEVINEPLKRSASALLNSIESGESLGGQVATNICFCMSFISSLYVLFLVNENTSKAKLLQFVGGVKIWIFWLTHLIWDMLTFSISAVVLIAVLACFQEKYFREFDNLMKILLLIIVFGLAALPLTYLLSYHFNEPATAFARISTINIFLGMALYICVMVMSVPLFNTKYIVDKIVWIFMLYPHFALAFGINELYMNLVTTDLCDSETLKRMRRTMVCQTVPQCCEDTPIFGFKRPGILGEFVYLMSIAGIFILILFMREYRWVKEYVLSTRICTRKKRPPPLPKDENNDTDIETEKMRIAALNIKKADPNKLVLDRVSKYYGEFLAVNQISFRVKGKECFGLLGINGAGKTTTFKILTGDEKLTYGNAYVRGHSIKTAMNKVYKQIGYCPQFDALLEDITGRQVLRIFCLLKNVPKDRINHLTEELAHSFGFTKHLDKAVHKYSGGNKRKLSVALAVIGKPSVIYLDEPTTGMDPAARRRLWNVVCMLRDMGKAIVLTSHSMEECEALCTRLAIMVNGELKCIGSIQHLKNKFSKGFILKIKVQSEFIKEKNRPTTRRSIKPDTSSTGVVNPIVDDVVHSLVPPEEIESEKSDNEDEEEQYDSSFDEVQQEIRRVSVGAYRPNTSMIRQAYSNILTTYIQERFPSAYLQDNFQGMLTYTIPITDVKWSEIFGFMERNLMKLNIEDYAITQTTLEEIFLDFAKKQIDTRVHRHRKGCRPTLKLKQCC